jgi:hypothetical protein
LQHQDLFDRGLSSARRRHDPQQGAQEQSGRFGKNAAIRTRSACRDPGVLRSGGESATA